MSGPRGGPNELTVLAVDGGNSKTDVVLIGSDGSLIAAVRGPTISHQVVGMEAGVDGLIRLADDAWARGRQPGSRPVAAIASYALAGADTPGDTRRLTRAFQARTLARDTVIVNDAFAPVRAGSDHGWGVAVICGAGVNAAGIAPDGRTARLAALGAISGDWGGGGDVGTAALGAAVRARDGRGPRTTLERAVPRHFALVRPIDVTYAIESGRLPERRLRELSPIVFAAAVSGDPVARAIVDRLADEIAVMAVAMIRRLHLARLDVSVTLAGGVFRAEDAAFETRIAEAIQKVAPRARVHRLGPPPVLGAALLGLDRAQAATPNAAATREARLRRELATDPASAARP